MRLSKDKIKSLGYKFDIFLQNFVETFKERKKKAVIFLITYRFENLLFVFIRKDIP